MKKFGSFAASLGLSVLMFGCGLGGPIELEAGWTGRKNLTGRFGGPTDATSFGPNCRGFVSTNPDHQVQVAAELPYVRFVVNGGPMDTTLAIQLPDGTYRCNDDGPGMMPNPMIEGPLPAGLIKVWIGAYSSGQTGNYRLGITTDNSVSPATLGAPASNNTKRRRRRRRRR